MAWTETVFTFGNSPSTLNASLEANGTALNVPVDGSSGIVVTYSSPFPTNTLQVIATVTNDPTVNPWGLSVSVSNKTKNGFTIFAEGGPSGQTVSIDWTAFGA